MSSGDPSRTARARPSAAISPSTAALDRAPLSEAQRALWFLDGLTPEGSTQIISRGFWVRGGAAAIDREALGRAIDRLVDRHRALHARFEVDGELVFQRFDVARDCFRIEELPGAGDDEIERALRAAEAHPVPLSEGPPFRLTVFVGASAAALLCSVHHIAVDLWSFELIVRDFDRIYRDELGEPSAAAPAARGLGEVSAAEGELLSPARRRKLVDHWRGALAGAPERLRLGTDHRGARASAASGARHDFELPADVAGRLRALGGERGVTAFATYLAAWFGFLHRVSGQPDLVVGTPAFGALRARFPEVVGCLSNPVALRSRIDAQTGLARLIEDTREIVFAALANQALPFSEVVEAVSPSRERASTPLYHTTFLFHQSRVAAALAPLTLGVAGVHLSVGGLELEALAVASRPMVFDLSFELAEMDGAVWAALRYRTDCFDPPAIARLSEAFVAFLVAAVADPEAPLARLPLGRSGGEREAAAGDPAVEVPALGLAELFARQSQATPDRIAVSDGDRRVSFRELDDMADRLAGRLRRAGVAAGDRVMVCLERSVESVAALLAALRLHAPWVAIEPNAPPERLRFILEDSRPRAVVTAARHRMAASAGIPLVDVDDPGTWAGPGLGKPAGRPHPDAVAYVVYTSGSSGRPKGVLATHRGTLNRFAWMWQRFPFADDVACHKTSLSFVDAVWEIFGPLMAGVPLAIIPSAVAADPEQLAGLLAAHGVTRIVVVPALLRALVELLDLAERLPALRSWFTSGEALPGELAARFFDRLPGRRLINLYGASEAAADSTWFEVAERSPTVVAIGRPIAGTWAYVLDDQLQPVPTGAEGELMIAGEGLARGYHGRPDLTAERFLPDPFAELAGARMYRTGDRARRLRSGDLEYLGRRDHQVKIHGVRIELGEIEEAAARLPGVAQAVATVREEAEPRLVLFWVPRAGGGPTAVELAAALRGELPATMMPTNLVELAGLPLTTSGKLDRQALAAIELTRSPLSDGPTAPRTATEAAVAAIWAEVLGRDPIGVHDDFFALGGRSLLATRVLARIRRRLGVELPVAALFASPTVAGLAGEIERAGAGAAASLPPPRRSPTSSSERPSFAQERMWLLHQLDPGGLSYQLAASVRARGPLDLARLACALAAVADRHEALRTAFVVEAGQPVARVLSSVDLPVPLEDLTRLPEGAREAAWRAGAEALARAPFDLASPPLLRLTVYRLAPDHHVIALVVHHIVWDDASTAVFLRELAAAYAGDEAAPLEVQAGDVSRWQRRLTDDGSLSGQLDYWRTTLDGAPTSIPIPTDHARPAAPSRRGLRIPIDLPAATVAALTAIARAQGAALPAALLAGLGLLLERYSGQRELLIGVPTAGRVAVEIEPLIGLFVNTLPIRLQIDDDDTVAAVIRRAGQALLAATAHQHVPVEQAVRTLPRADLGGGFFQVALNVRTPGGVPAALADLALEPPELIELGTSKFDLLLDVDPDPTRPRAWLEVDADLFSSDTAARMARHVEAALDGMAGQPEARAVRLSLLADDERTRLLATATVEPIVPGGADTIHQRVADQARRTPDAIALSCGDRRMSYGELEARSNQLAHRLRQLGAGPETRIGVHLDPSIEMVVALLGVLKAGAAFLPLDGTWPDERVRFVLADAGATALITSAERAADRPDDPLPTVVLDPAWSSLARLPAAPPPEIALPGSLAYVIYTSGSTGRPKGTLIPHDRVLRLFDATRDFELGSADVWTLFHSVAFDFSVWEIWGALMHGGRLVIVPHLVSRSPEELRRLLTVESVTVLNQTPLAFRQLIAADAADSAPLSLRLVLFGGDALDLTTLRPWFERHGDARPRLVNLYGITETTVHNTIRWLTAGDVDGPGQASVGRPIRDVRLLVLDRHGQLAPVGVPGEIYVGGAGLARGYIGRPDLTAERFVPDPFSGEPGARLYRSGDGGRVLAGGAIECLGRLDRQIKLRGHRIELEDIERTLRALPDVADAAVAVEGEDPATQVLVAYLVLRDDHAAAAPELRAAAGRWLPAYMVPARMHLVEALPRTRNGKLDRAALRAAESRGGPAAIEAPEGPIEIRIARIWCDVLEREEVGRSDNFFALGGHSLLAIEAMNRLREELGLDVPIRLLFEEPDLRQLALAVLRAYLDRFDPTVAAALVGEIAGGQGERG